MSIVQSTPTPVNFGPIGADVYNRTYSRPLAGGNEEWPDTVRRVVRGNFALDPGADVWEAKAFTGLMDSFALLPAGRHLWVTGIDGIPGEARRNCFRAPFTRRLADHFEFMGSMLLLGGGVGANYSQEYLDLAAPIRQISLRITCDPAHPDYETVRTAAGFRFLSSPMHSQLVHDSREGWVKAWGSLIDMATGHSPHAQQIVLDVSQVRPHGAVIKTFGGTASGPGPLVDSLVGITEILRGAVGRKLTGIEAMSCDHAIASAVVAGGARRSARMSIMHWQDPSILEFIQCKADHLHHWTTNISVEVDAEFFTRLHAGDPHVNHVFESVITGMYLNGEPGFYNVTNAAIGERRDVRATNPCVSGDTWVQTAEGLRTVESLVGVGPVNILVDGKSWASTDAGFFQTDVRPVLEVDIDGSVLKMTHDHLVSTPAGWVTAGSLKVGDTVNIPSEPGTGWEGRGFRSDGYLLGTLIGDGTFSSSAILDVWPDDTQVVEVINQAITDSGLVHRSDWRGFRLVGDGKLRLGSAALRDMAATYGIVRGNKTVTPELMEQGSSELFVGVLQGLFDTDGHVEGSSTQGGVSVRLTQSDYEMLGRVRIMLMALGIKSSVRSSHPAGRRGLPGQLNDSQASFRLVISGSDVARFQTTVGFRNERKATLLSAKLGEMSRGTYNKPRTAIVRSVKVGATVPVYDVQVPGLNMFVANGTIVHNCGEVPLEEGESCNIGSVDLEEFGTDDEGAIEAFRLMTRFLIRQTLTPITTEPTATVETRNRRIGVGFLGFQGWAAAHGVRYSDAQHSGVLSTKLRTFRREIRAEADAYCDELGIPRCIKVTAIAPNGTIAQLKGTQPGGHATLARYCLRNVRYTTGDPRIAAALAAGLKVEPCIYAANTMVVGYPVADRLVERFDKALIEQIDEVSIDDQFGVLEMITSEFCGGADGNAVSFTASFDPTTTSREELRTAVAYWLPVVKGLTVFPTMSRPQSPYEPMTEAEYQRYVFTGQVDTGIEDLQACAGGSCPIR